MDGVDYSKALKNERSSFYDKLDKSRNAAKKDLEKVENQAAYRSDRQKDTHKKQLDSQEKVLQDRLVQTEDVARQKIQEKTEDFKNKLLSEREDFSKQKSEELGKYNNRLNSLSDAYRRNADEREKQVARQRELDADNYSYKAQDLDKKHRDELSGYYDKQKLNAQLMSSNLERERSRISKETRDDKELQTYQYNTQRTRENNEMKRQIDQIRQNSEDIDTHSKKQVQHHIALNNDDKNDKLLRMEQNYDDSKVKGNMAHALEKEKIVKNNKKYIADQEKEFNKERIRRETEMKRQSGEDKMGEFAAKDKDLKHKEQLSTKQKQYRDSLDTVSKKFNSELAQNQEDAYIQRRSDAIEFAKKDENREKDNALYVMDKVGGMNKDKADMVQAYTDQAKINNENANRELANEKERGELRFNNIKRTFASTVNDLTDKTQRELNDIRQREAQERNALIKQNREFTHQTISETKKDNENKINKTTNDYEKRLSEMQMKMREVIRFYEDKVAAVRQEATSSMDKQQYLHSEQRKQDGEDMRNQMAIRENELNRTIDSWRDRYNKDLNTQAFEYERRMRIMSKDYEAKIDQLMTDQDRERARFLSEMSREMDRVKSGNEADKARIISQYENIVGKMKETIEAKDQAARIYQKQVDKNA